MESCFGRFVRYDREFERASKDPDDDKYIAAAIEGRAGFVVAGDSDLLEVKVYDGIRIVSPRVFRVPFRSSGRSSSK